MKIPICFALATAALLAPTTSRGSPSQVTHAHAEVRPGCFRESVRIPRNVAMHLPDRMFVAFAVDANGAVTSVKAISHVVDKRATRLVSQALRRCAWRGAAGDSGSSAVAMMPIRFAN
jgi:hypothetical protein